MNDKKLQKLAKTHKCDCCYYECNKYSDYNKHLLTNKHAKMTLLTKKATEVAESIFICNCGKEYTTRQGLWKHKKICNYQEPFITNTFPIEMQCDIILEIVKQNKEFKEFKEIMIEQNKQIVEQNKKLIELAEKEQCNTNNSN